jgi:hypothetical protein
MANIDIQNNDLGPLMLGGEEFEDGLIAFAGTDTFAAGTILARNTSTLKFQLYVKGGSSNGNGVPVGVLTYAVSRTGAGDVMGRVLMKGKVNAKRLIIDADGDDSNIDATVRDLLRSKAIVPENVTNLSRYDNPQPTESDS